MANIEMTINATMVRYLLMVLMMDSDRQIATNVFDLDQVNT